MTYKQISDFIYRIYILINFSMQLWRVCMSMFVCVRQWHSFQNSANTLVGYVPPLC